MAFVETKPITNGTAGDDSITGGLNGTTPTTGVLFSTDAGSGVRIFGGAGNDTLWGSALGDTLVGGDGNDVLRGGLGGDIMTGGTGNDAFLFYNTASHQNDLGIGTSGWLGSGGDIIQDLSTTGAGGRDFIGFVGYGTTTGGAHLDFDHVGTAADNSSSTYQFYKVYAGTDAQASLSGGFSWLAVQMYDHGATHLAASSYAFFG